LLFSLSGSGLLKSAAVFITSRRLHKASVFSADSQCDPGGNPRYFPELYYLS
jgi:hypothetical protein